MRKRNQVVVIKMTAPEKATLERLAQIECHTMADAVRHLIIEGGQAVGIDVSDVEQEVAMKEAEFQAEIHRIEKEAEDEADIAAEIQADIDAEEAALEDEEKAYRAAIAEKGCV